MLGRNVEAVLIRVSGSLAVARFGQQDLVFLVQHVAEAFVKQKTEDVSLVVPCIDRAAQDVRGTPQMTFKILLRQFAY